MIQTWPRALSSFWHHHSLKSHKMWYFRICFFQERNKLDQHVTPALRCCAVIKAICYLTGFLKLLQSHWDLVQAAEAEIQIALEPYKEILMSPNLICVCMRERGCISERWARIGHLGRAAEWADVSQANSWGEWRKVRPCCLPCPSKVSCKVITSFESHGQKQNCNFLFR